MNQIISTIDTYLNNIQDSLASNTFVKLVLTNRREKEAELKRIIVKRVLIKSGSKLNFVYRNLTNDITKNYSINESLVLIKELMSDTFFQSDLYTTTNNFYLSINENDKAKISVKAPTETSLSSLDHNKQKSRIVDSNKNYLTLLGVTNKNGEILKTKHSKFRQINKFIELLDPAIKSISAEKELFVIDMGSGLGYLTFALYDYFMSQEIKAKVTGIELRQELVNKCNTIAKECQLENLNFKEGTIQNIQMQSENVVIALHACDTATDDALAKGIQNNAELIVCSPCCHKQIRKELDVEKELKPLVQHGILKERQAEIITDTIRSLILEAHGYDTKVVEFISSEHTSKNLLIIATKTNDIQKLNQDKLDSIKSLKKLFGIKEHYLEKILSI